MLNQKQAVYYTRALVDSEQLEWIELSADTEDQDPSQGGEGGLGEDPLGWNWISPGAVTGLFFMLHL